MKTRHITAQTRKRCITYCPVFREPRTQVGDSIADYCLFITGGGTKGNSGFDFKEAFRSSPLALAPAASYCEHASKVGVNVKGGSVFVSRLCRRWLHRSLTGLD